MHLIFGLLLLATGVNAAQDFFITAATKAGVPAFDLDAYARATPADRRENGINPDYQQALLFINSQYQIIKDTDPDSPLLDQLKLTARALVKGYLDDSEYRLTGDGFSYVVQIMRETSNFHYGEGGAIVVDSSEDLSSRIARANIALVALNTGVNKLYPEAANELKVALKPEGDADFMDGNQAGTSTGWREKFKSVLQWFKRLFGYGDSGDDCRRRNRRMLLQACPRGNEEVVSDSTGPGGDIVDIAEGGGGTRSGVEDAVSDGSNTDSGVVIETGSRYSEGIDTVDGISNHGIEAGGIATGGIETLDGIVAGGAPIETGGIATGGIERGPSGGESAVVEGI